MRSRNYPSISLPTAISAIQKMWKSDGKNEIEKTAVAKHLGYSSVSGASLTKMGALRGYGLLSGQGNALKVSDQARTIIAEPVGSRDRKEAVNAAARTPKVFSELLEHFKDRPSEANLRAYLIRSGFDEKATKRIMRSYLETLDFLSQEGCEEEQEPEGDDNREMEQGALEGAGSSQEATRAIPAPLPDATINTFDLDSGQASISFPRQLSGEDLQDLEAWLDLVLKRAKRTAKATGPTDSGETGRSTRGAGREARS